MCVRTSFVRVGCLSLAVIAGSFFSTTAQAAISAINSASSSASITFDDTFSLDPLLTPGITNAGPAVSPWTGAPVILPLTTDPITFDDASGTVDATFLGNTYAINFSSVTLEQAPLNTGIAHLTFTFTVEYQLDAAGLPSQATLFPAFTVNGTVQPTAGSFAAVTGFIDYIGVNTAGTIGIVETVNYNNVWNVPGNFTGTATGIPVGGTTPLFVPNTTLTLNGVITFTVDPASINAFSNMVPEPASLAVFGLAAVVLAGRRGRRLGLA